MDEQRLTAWWDQCLGAGGPLAVTPVQGGASNLIFRIERDGRSYALRRPPAVSNDPTSNNIGRELKVLRALAHTDIPHTRLVAGCEDAAVIGAPFALLEWDAGFTAKDPLPGAFASDPALRRAMAFELVDAIARVSRADWRAIGLADFGKPEGFLERQVERWAGQLARYRSRDIDGLDELAQWLKAHTPAMQRSSLVHGDYQFINVLFRRERPVKLSAIVDWEMATIGDPLLDLGWMLAGWQEEGEEATFANYIGWHGFPTRAELAARYAEASGLSVAELPYYMALAMYKLAIIMEGAYARFAKGQSTLAAHGRMKDDVPLMVRRGLRFAGLR